jgi:hypothetical protein
MLVVVMVAGIGIMPVLAGFENELVVDFFRWNGSESFTNLDIPGVVVYQKSFWVPDETPFDYHHFLTDGTSGDQSQVMNVSFWATADNHAGGRLLLGCFISQAPSVAGAPFVPCHDGSTFSVGFPGWVSLLRLPAATTGTNCNNGGGGTADCHDNKIHYDWCIPRDKFFLGRGYGGYNTVQIRLAQQGGDDAIFEGAQVKINTATIESTRPDGFSINPCVAFSGP